MGRKAKPTQLKVVEGNPGKRPLNEDEPQYGECPVDPPEYLTERAADIWRVQIKKLIESGVLTEADEEMFAAYCEKRADWLYYKGKAEETSDLVKTPNGHFQQNPYISMANKAFEQMVKLASEFGITPSSRSRVSLASNVRRNDKADKYF